MTSVEKHQVLRSIIKDRLTPLVNHDYRYLMMCDHQNIGDTLIMEGEFQFLRTITDKKCKEYTTMVSFQQRRPIIPKNDLLIMRGSGSFGDIWPTAPKFWKFVMECYPENPILFMPQTIHFSDPKNLDDIACIINRHKNVVLCVRDEESFNIAKTHFKCDIHLVPDMAFFIDSAKLSFRAINQSSQSSLVVKREDKECNPTSFLDSLICDPNVHVSDWPTFKNVGRIEKMRRYLLERKKYRLYDLYVKHIFRPYIIRQGINFLNPYSVVYATRMHAGILAMLMGKRVHFLDNNYGKLERVYNTWIKDTDNVFLNKS